MDVDLIRCEYQGCQCTVQVPKAVIRQGKAFCSEACADGHGCGCHRGWCPSAMLI
ncbi:metallothionein [Synechococcus sp. UW179A]|uniref:metallothionein n=1 Tax=Synechococcus sp. UW179A TaxID=2575510 RepID=UPI000E0FEC2D|nr:metallothionein [Synechococcus sp. UW179A]